MFPNSFLYTQLYILDSSVIPKSLSFTKQWANWTVQLTVMDYTREKTKLAQK